MEKLSTLINHDQPLPDSTTADINGMKRKRTPMPDEDPISESHKRAKTSPDPTLPEVPKTPPSKASNGLSTPNPTDGESSRVGDKESVPSSVTSTRSQDSSATLQAEQTAAVKEQSNRMQDAVESNDEVSTASRQPADQLSIAETDASGNAAAAAEHQPPEVLSSPSVSPLSTPPSSPALNAQERYFWESRKEIALATEAEPPALNLDDGEPGQDANGFDDEMADSMAAENTASVQQDGSASSRDIQDPATATPMSKTQPVQLPTPASSNPSADESSPRFPPIWFSTRFRKPPEKFGDLVETPATPEETGTESDSDTIKLQTKKAPTKKTPLTNTPAKRAPASSKLKRSSAGESQTKTKASTTEGANKVTKPRATKSNKVGPTEKTTSAQKPGAKPHGRPKKPTPPAATSLEETNATRPSKVVALPVTPQPNTTETTAAPATAPKGRKKSNTKAQPLPKPSKETKKAASNLVSLVPAERPPIEVDPVKLGLSQKLSSREPLETKPDPKGQPRVWAESRQALCETLPYFKKPQGGCYSNDGHVYGFLFDGVGHCREYLDENLILCRAGGSMEPDNVNGGMAQKKDQTMTESQVLSVLNDMKHHNPLIVICGNRNVAAPTKMPHQYNVLGWYKPVFVWAEKTQGKGSKVWTTIKYRLERLNQHKDPAWHAPSDEAIQISDEEKAIAGPLFTKACNECSQNSPQIYLEGWMCLNPGCDEFWQLPNGWAAPYGKDGLNYDPAFLLHRFELWKDDNQEREPVPVDVKPVVPKVGDIIGDNLYYINTRGVCCPECGRCNSRRKFKGWVCENCGWNEYPKHNPVLPTMLHTPWDAAPTLVRNKHADGVQIEAMHLHGYKVSRYTFKGIDGCFMHLAASKQLNEEPQGANDMFAELQTVDMGLERRVFAVSKMSGGRKSMDAPQESANDQPMADLATTQENGETGEIGADKTAEEFAPGDLMTAFSMNYGMPYKFVASGGSQSFDDAPWPVTETRRRLNWAQKTFLSNQDEFMDFNEQLIFAYLEGQKIEYHDDGESGLGPRIATMSLGGRAKMHLRMKAKHYVGCSKTGILTEERPVPGSIDGEDMYNKRLAKWEELQALKVSDPAAYSKRRKELPKELGIFEKKMKKADDLVTVTLSHGDIIIMDGYDIQKYLEHKVLPEGYLRFALTCRTVLPDHLKPEELPSYTVEVDPITYDGPKLGEAREDE